MTKYQIISTPLGIRAKEINPWGKKPVRFVHEGWNSFMVMESERWQTAEANLKEYEVSNYCECATNKNKHCNISCGRTWPVGSIVEGEIINGKLKIK